MEIWSRNSRDTDLLCDVTFVRQEPINHFEKRLLHRLCWTVLIKEKRFRGKVKQSWIFFREGLSSLLFDYKRDSSGKTVQTVDSFLSLFSFGYHFTSFPHSSITFMLSFCRQETTQSGYTAVPSRGKRHAFFNPFFNTSPVKENRVAEDNVFLGWKITKITKERIQVETESTKLNQSLLKQQRVYMKDYFVLEVLTLKSRVTVFSFFAEWYVLSPGASPKRRLSGKTNSLDFI
jgi:hypothetical protein